MVGSTALGAYRERRSDIDFVAVVEGAVGDHELRRLRAQHRRSGRRTAVTALRQRRSPLTGTCNGIFVRREDLTRPVGEIVPAAAHIGHTFVVGPVGSDVSPVAWKVLAERGISIRGAAPSDLGLDPEPGRLRAWNRENLESYWRPWATADGWGPRLAFGSRPRWSTAWGVLGAPRLHATIATGEVISKEAAGAYALDVFPPSTHPLVTDALAWWRGEPPRLDVSLRERRAATRAFVLEVVASAADLPLDGP